MFNLLIGCNEQSTTIKSEIEEVDDFEYVEIGEYATNNSFYQTYDRALQLYGVKLKQHDINTKKGTAHVIECGNVKGEPLVLLHGMNATSTMWYTNIKQLAEKYHIYAIDFLLEPGKSEMTTEVDEIDEIVGWYNEIFNKLNLEEVNLLGASRGGWLSVNIAIKGKVKVKKMALLSPAQTFVWISPGKDLISNIAFSINPERKNLRSVLSTLSSDVEQIDQTYIDLFYMSSEQAKIRKAILEMRPFSDEDMQSLKMPVLLLVGDDDFINPPKSIDKAKGVLSNLTASTVKNAGHFLSIDQYEVVNRQLLDFFK